MQSNNVKKYSFDSCFICVEQTWLTKPAECRRYADFLPSPIGKLTRSRCSKYSCHILLRATKD